MIKTFLTICLVFLSGSGGYAQATLGTFLDSALKNNPQLIESRNNILLTENNKDLFKSGLKTQVGFSTDLAWDPVVNGYGYDDVITNGQVVSTLVNFDKEILFSGQLANQMKDYDIRRDQAGNQLRLSEAALKRDITSQFLTTWGDMLQWQYNSDILKSLQGEDSLLAVLTRSNIYRQTDYYTFKANLKSQELAVSNALLQYRHSLMQLRYFAGMEDTVFILLSPPELEVSARPSRSSSVFFRQFSLDSLSLQNRLRLIDIGYQPKLSLHADAGYLSSLILNPYKNFGAGIGLKLSVPIYDGKQKELKYKNVRLLQENNLSRESWFEKQYTLKLERFIQMLSDLETQAGEISNQKAFYESLIGMEKKLFSTGQLDVTQYFLILRNYIDVRNESAKNQVRQLMLINEINYLAN